MFCRKESGESLAQSKVRNVWQEGKQKIFGRKESEECLAGENWNSVGKEIVNMVERKQRILWEVNSQYNKKKIVIYMGKKQQI